MYDDVIVYVYINQRMLTLSRATANNKISSC